MEMKFDKWLKMGIGLALSATVLAACGKSETKEVPEESGAGSEATGELAAMTEEEITLTFASWENPELQQHLAKDFMEKYPNITVELVTVDQENWNDGLTNLANTGSLPDVFWYQGNVDVPIVNGWLGDMTEQWEADPESSEVLETLQQTGYVDNERKMAAAVFYQPYTVFLDENVFNKLNVDMPSPDWKYSEMIDLMKKMTVPEQEIFGYNDFTKLVTMGPIVQADSLGEFGWDGEKFDMTAYWAESMTQQAELMRTGVHAPFFDTDEAEAAFGDRLLWAASTGRIAMQLDAWWTKDLFATDEFVDKGIKWVPYPVPQGDNAESQNKPGFVDFGSVSSATEHPREAYELLKFMGWGKEGWNSRLEAYKTLTNDDGSKLFTYPAGLPLTQDQTIWDAVAAELPDNEYYKNYLSRVKNPVPLGGAVIPGFQTFLEEVYFGGEYGDVEAAIIAGTVNASDIAADLTEKLNQYYEDAMAEIF